MEAIFWLLVGAIFYTYFGYPLSIALLSVFVRRDIARGEDLPTVTFLITAYNERKSLRQKLLNTLELDYPRGRMEVIVASDASDDGTDDIVREFVARGVRLLRMERRGGKTLAQNEAVNHAHGEIVIFSDATTRYDKAAVRMIVRNFADPSVGAVGGRFKYYDPGRTHVGTGTIAFWDYEVFIKNRQTRINTITGCSGCIYAVRRSLYEALPAEIVSDLVEPLKVLEKGYRIVFEPEALAFEETCKRHRDEFRMRVRVISRGMQGIIYMRSLLNPLRYPFISFQLISHKVLRWFVPFFAVALYAASGLLVGEGRIYAVAFALQAVFYFLAFVGMLAELFSKQVRFLSLPLYFCIINSASVVALVRTIRNRREVVWNTVRE